MQLTNIFAVLATGLAVVSAQDDTTTCTSTMTRTFTVTKCNPTYTACPLYNSTTSAIYTNTSVSASPTPYANSTTYVLPTSTSTKTSVVTAATSPATVQQGAAGSLIVNSGLLVGLIGAGMALLA